MALDDFSSDSNGDSNEGKSDFEKETEGVNIQNIAEVTLTWARKDSTDVQVEGRQLKGSAEDFAMLFALMFLEIPDAEPSDIEIPE